MSQILKFTVWFFKSTIVSSHISIVRLLDTRGSISATSVPFWNEHLG
jgi:hypothetical protein